jgi:16S rRNA (adenine1518-N6/adenine1519-N6)-dimethyltransferase
MAERLLDPRTIRRLAAELDLRPTKQRGQNFVHDANTVRRIVAAAGLAPTDSVLEIGPGLGSLTLGLLEAVAHVTAIEIESSLARRLPQTASERLPELAGRLTVLEADALAVTVLPDPQPGAMVANLPYNVSVPVILHLLAEVPTLRHVLVMVQAEVADRLVAPPGSRTYGVPSAKLAWYGSARRVGSVPPTVFWPVPNVESGLVAMVVGEPPATTATREAVFAVVDAAFGQRRKMLRGALAGLAGGSERATAALVAAGVDPQARGEVLGIAEFAAIAEALQGVG